MNRQGTLSRSECAGRYAAVRSQLNTFDVINCEHNNWLLRAIGHTAMIYKELATGQIFVYESTELNKFTGIKGVQLTPMRLWLHYYPGKVFVRQFYKEGEPREYIPIFSWSLYNKRMVMAARSIQKHIKKYRGTPYPDLSDPRQAMFVANAAIDLPMGIGENPDRHDIFFCTQLVVDALQYCGLYIGDEPPSEAQPDDTRPGGRIEKQLAKGLSLGKEIRLK